jgi:hypothetical protein
MREKKLYRIQRVLTSANRDKKGDLRVYEYYKRCLQELDITPREYEQAVRKLANVLRV